LEGKNGIDVMPSKVTGLKQILELFNIRICVGGEKTKEFFYLREFSKGKGDMYPHNSFNASHFLERIDGNWLNGGSMRASVCGGHGILWFWVGGGAGRKRGRRRGGRGGRRRGRGLMAEQWKPVSDKVEAL
jgi:hypothetical protein